MPRSLLLLLTLIPLAAACGDSTPTTMAPADAGPTDVGSADVALDRPAPDQDAAADVPVVPDMPVVADGGASVPVLNACTEAMYEERSATDAERTVRPRGSTGYTPRCVTIRAGQSVVFEMSFTTHPLVPGVPHGSIVGATSPNPIAAQSAGTTYTVPFTDAGYFPFYCRTHGHVGMAGVVRVQP
jgi:plastocyanin